MDPLAQATEDLCRQIGKLIESQCQGQATPQRLFKIVSMSIGYIQQQLPEASLAQREQATIIISRALENIAGHQLGGSTLVLKEQGRAALQHNTQHLVYLGRKVRDAEAIHKARHSKRTMGKLAPRWGIRMPPPVPAAIIAVFNKQRAEAAQTRSEDHLQQQQQPVQAVPQGSLPPAAPTCSAPHAHDGCCGVSARIQVLPSPGSQSDDAVRLELQVQRAHGGPVLPASTAAAPAAARAALQQPAAESQPNLQPQTLGELIQLKVQRSKGLVLSARQRVWRHIRAHRSPAHITPAGCTSEGMQAGTGCCAARRTVSQDAAADDGQGGSVLVCPDASPAPQAAAPDRPKRCIPPVHRALQTAAALVGPYTTAVLRPAWKQQREVRARINAAILEQHSEIKKAWREARLKVQRERMAALKSNNVEEYMRLVQGAKNSKIDKLLEQTDQCLRLLTQRLDMADGELEDPNVARDTSRGSPSVAGGSQVAALQQSNETWNKLARAFEADIQKQPQLLTGGELHEYQMKGLRWMVGLHDNRLNGILADEMGLGKTIQVISLICYMAESRGEKRPFLIAVPSSVLPNWEREFVTWAPKLNVVSYKGSADARQEIFYKQMLGGRSGAFHVALTSYDFLMGKADRPRLSRVSWSYIVVDEGHRLKNAGCKLNAELKQYKAGHRLLLTGTPLQNRLEELWSLLNFLMPSLFDSSDDFQTWFGSSMQCRPEQQAGGGGGDEDEAAADAAMLSQEEALIVTSRLHQVLRPFMLRRLKESVATELPQKVERLIPCQPSAYQRALFGLIETELKAAEGKTEGRAGVKGINNTVMEMRNICNHPMISRLHPTGAETALPPHCLPAEVRLCGKLELLDRMLVKLHAGGHRVLLFSTMTRLLDVLEDYLDWRGFHHLRLDGNTSSAERGELVNQFNAPGSKVFVFLLSIRAGGVGLNLQSADTVIMYDTDWNPQMDLQAQARAHRLGQTKEVLVLRLQTMGTVEERIIGVASEKLGMADRSITGGFFDGKTSAAERQKYLLDMIRSTQKTSRDAGAPSSGQLSDEQLNELLARGDAELELFAAEDKRIRAAELSSLKGLAGTQGPAGYSRLASEADIEPLVEHALAQARPVDEDEGKEFGRGKRGRGGVTYKDMGERDFKRLCRDGASGITGAVKLLDAASEPPAPAPAVTATKRHGTAAADGTAGALQDAGSVENGGHPIKGKGAPSAPASAKPSLKLPQLAGRAGKGGEQDARPTAAAASLPPVKTSGSSGLAVQQQASLPPPASHTLPSSPRTSVPRMAPIQSQQLSHMPHHAAAHKEAPQAAGNRAASTQERGPHSAQGATVRASRQKQPISSAGPAVAQGSDPSSLQQLAEQPKQVAAKQEQAQQPGSPGLAVAEPADCPDGEQGQGLAAHSESPLSLLGCKDAKQAQQKIGRMERKQLQELFEKVHGSAPNVRTSDSKLQAKLNAALATPLTAPSIPAAAPANKGTAGVRSRPKRAGNFGVSESDREDASTSGLNPAPSPPTQPSRRSNMRIALQQAVRAAQPPPVRQPAATRKAVPAVKLEKQQEAAELQVLARHVTRSAAPAPPAVRSASGTDAAAVTAAGTTHPATKGPGGSVTAVVQSPARHLTRSAAQPCSSSPGPPSLQQAAAAREDAGPAAKARYPEAVAASLLRPTTRSSVPAPAAPTGLPKGGASPQLNLAMRRKHSAGGVHNGSSAGGATGAGVVVAKYLTAGDLKQGVISLQTAAVEAAVGNLPEGPLDVAALEGKRTCSLRCYVSGNVRMYKLLANSFVVAAGAKLGDAFAIVRDAQGGLTAELNTPRALHAAAGVGASPATASHTSGPAPDTAHKPQTAAPQLKTEPTARGSSRAAAGGGEAKAVRDATASTIRKRTVAVNAPQPAASTPPAEAATRETKPDPEWPEDVVGTRVAVYWPDDVAWYSGTITSFNGRKHKVAYDDGDTEYISLDRESVRLLPSLPSQRQPATTMPAAQTPGTDRAACLGGEALLQVLGCKDAEQAQQEIGRMERKQLQELFAKVYGHAPDVRRDNKKLQHKLRAALTSPPAAPSPNRLQEQQQLPASAQHSAKRLQGMQGQPSVSAGEAAAGPSKPSKPAPPKQVSASAAAAARPQTVAAPVRGAAETAGTQGRVPPAFGGNGEGEAGRARLASAEVLSLLGCNDAKQAQQKIERMERKQLQELFESVYGYAPDVRRDNKKLQKKLCVVLSAPAASGTPAKRPQKQKQHAAAQDEPGPKRHKPAPRATQQAAEEVAALAAGPRHGLAAAQPPPASTPASNVGTAGLAGGVLAVGALRPPELLRLLGVGSLDAGRGLVQLMDLKELQDMHAKVFSSLAPASIRQSALRKKLMQALAGEKAEN